MNQNFLKLLPENFSDAQENNLVFDRILREYGAMFVARNGAVAPDKVIFNNESEVSKWQSGVPKTVETIGGITIELQTCAMNALKEAVSMAGESGLTITPRGEDAARRNYSGTVSLWESRVTPGLAHWIAQERLTQTEGDRIKALPVNEQIGEILKLETQGIFFSKDLSKSIIYSVAPPGTSQHISMLALDVAEHDNSKVRIILAKHGWFQTVVSDLPHFTYLGVNESELSSLGLKKVSDGERVYWLPK